ncbi:IS5 family transposase (plasmid) [Streptomyces sp. NBC_00841]|uniref:IS5 family transposase n=1 Tax=Streptomyces sp. NBC_00841 TaxID=2975847 RepID=UPI0030894751|nr:IS5 family transposase [Streptomyces sp. NBC_00841]
MTERRAYPSDLKDDQWELIEPLLLAWRAARAEGREPTTDLREVVNAVLYVARTGVAWRYLPHDFPPHTTVYGYFRAWEADGTAEEIHDTLREQLRRKKGRRILPTAAVIDAQTAKASPNAPESTQGYDGGKRIKGRKRHIATDTLGLLLVLIITAAGVHAELLGRNLRAAGDDIVLHGHLCGRAPCWPVQVDAVLQVAGHAYVADPPKAGAARCPVHLDEGRQPEDHASAARLIVRAGRVGSDVGDSRVREIERRGLESDNAADDRTARDRPSHREPGHADVSAMCDPHNRGHRPIVARSRGVGGERRGRLADRRVLADTLEAQVLAADDNLFGVRSAPDEDGVTRGGRVHGSLNC